MKLYRGDKIWSSSEPGRYRFDGIRSKSFGKGKPAYIKAEMLLETIRQHINPASPLDQLIYNSTEFISFSTSQSRAMFWLSDKNSLDLHETNADYQETRYLFEVNINECELSPFDRYETMFLYRFACNYELKMSNSSSLIEQAIIQGTPPGTYFKSCPMCQKTERNHLIVLIDAPKYLQKYKNSDDYDGAIINAQDDNEWLILPVDRIAQFSGTTIPRADFWSAKHYIGEGETSDPLLHEIQGISY